MSPSTRIVGRSLCTTLLLMVTLVQAAETPPVDSEDESVAAALKRIETEVAALREEVKTLHQQLNNQPGSFASGELASPRFSSRFSGTQVHPWRTDPANRGAAESEALWKTDLQSRDATTNAHMIAKLMDSGAPPAVRRTALNVLGHLGLLDVPTFEQIVSTVAAEPQVFTLSADHRLVNPGFEEVQEREAGELTGAFGEEMFAPGSSRLVGWDTHEGPTGLQWRSPSPGGGNALELGPRDVPGSISQTLRTVPGRTYQIRFFGGLGRSFSQGNRKGRLKVGDLDVTFECPTGSAYQVFSYEFRPNSLLTTVSFWGIGTSGFGPLIDDVFIALKDLQ